MNFNHYVYDFDTKSWECTKNGLNLIEEEISNEINELNQVVREAASEHIEEYGKPSINCW